MKIGLYISSSCAKDPLAYAFANLLSEGLGNRVQTLTRHDKLDPTLDLVHILGGNDLYSCRLISTTASKHIPSLYSPLGEILPWTNTQSSMRFVLQKSMMKSSQAIHAWSRTEQNYLERILQCVDLVFIPNAVVTRTISKEDMCDKFIKLYQKIIDTHVEMAIDRGLRQDVYSLLQIGLDYNLLQDKPFIGGVTSRIQTFSEEQWRHIMLYSYDQGIIDYIHNALERLQIRIPLMDIRQIKTFDNSIRQADCNEETIQTGNAIDIVYATISKIIEDKKRGCPLLSRYASCYKLLHNADYDEDKLVEMLKRNHLFQKAKKLMTDMQEITGLSEGFIPALLYSVPNN